jgi:hypothetical protein
VWITGGLGNNGLVGGNGEVVGASAPEPRETVQEAESHGSRPGLVVGRGVEKPIEGAWDASKCILVAPVVPVGGGTLAHIIS